MEEISTHNLIVDFGKHKGEPWTRLPKSYLRWLANETEGEKKELALAEMKRRGTNVTHEVELSGHSIDRASQITKEWEQEGLYTWLERMAREALDTSDEDEIFHKGYKLAFSRGDYYPVLKTIIKK